MAKYQELLKVLDNGRICAIESLDDINFFIGGCFDFTNSNNDDNKIVQSGNFCYYNSTANKFYNICNLDPCVNSIYIDSFIDNKYTIYVGGTFTNITFLTNVSSNINDFNKSNINNIIKLIIEINNNIPTILSIDTMNNGIEKDDLLFEMLNDDLKIFKIKKFNDRLFILSDYYIYEYDFNFNKFIEISKNIKKFNDDMSQNEKIIYDFDYCNLDNKHTLYIVGNFNYIENIGHGYIGLCSYNLDTNQFDSNKYNPNNYLINYFDGFLSIQVDIFNKKLYLIKSISSFDIDNKNLLIYNLIENKYNNIITDNDIFFDNTDILSTNKHVNFYDEQIRTKLFLKKNKLYIIGGIFNKFGNNEISIDCNGIGEIDLDTFRFNNIDEGFYYDTFLSKYVEYGRGTRNYNLGIYIDNSHNNIYIGGYYDTISNKKFIIDINSNIYYASFSKYNFINKKFYRLKGVYNYSSLSNSIEYNNVLYFYGDRFIYGLDKDNNLYRSDGIVKYNLISNNIEKFGWVFNKSINYINIEKDNMYIAGSFNHVYKLENFSEELLNNKQILNFVIFDIKNNKFTENFNNSNYNYIQQTKNYLNKTYLLFWNSIYSSNNNNLELIKQNYIPNYFGTEFFKTFEFFDNFMFFFDTHIFMKYNISEKRFSEVLPNNGKFEIDDEIKFKKFDDNRFIMYGYFNKIGNNKCNSIAIYNILENKWEKFFVFDKINYIYISDIAIINDNLIFGGNFSIEHNGILLNNIGMINLKNNNVYNFDGGFNDRITNLSVRNNFIDIFGDFLNTPKYSIINKNLLKISCGYVTFDLSYIEPIPCILKGTLIKTTLGYISVENLNKNHIIVTDTLSLAKIDKIFKTEKYKSSYDELPVLYSKNCFGNNIPNKDTYLSQKHAVFYKKENKWIIPKYNPDYYFNEFGIKVDKYEKDSILTYYHIKLKDYKDNLVVSGGLVIESLNLGKTTWKKDGNYYIRDYKIKHKII